MEQLPQACQKSVKRHINSIYVGTIIRIYDPSYEPFSQLATAHWNTEEGLFITLHTEQRYGLINLKYEFWLVDHRCIEPGAFKLHSRSGTNDVEDDFRDKTISEIQQRNSRILKK